MHFYDFVSYCGMLTDEVRLDAYVESLRRTVNADSVVLDLGAGTGIFSILSCEFGARKVYALEANPLIRLVEETAKERGFANRIEIIRKLSSEVELDEKANLLVSDIHGAFPLFESSIETIIDARKRLLTDNAVMIPEKESIFFAVSESPEIYEKNVTRFLADFHGFKIPSSERLVKNRWFSARSKDERLLGTPGLFAEIDCKSIKETSFSADLEWEIRSDGTAHGLRGWFENVLFGEIGLGNSIDVDETTYSSPFFPFEHPVEVQKGDLVKAKISASYAKGDYAWGWRTKIFSKGKKNKAKAEFDQTVMASLAIDPKMALRQSEYHTPQINEDGRIDLMILRMIDGEMLSGDIADAVIEKFPSILTSFDDGLARVFAVSERYRK